MTSFFKLDKLDQIGFLLACVFAFFAFSMADIAHTCAALMLIIVVISKRFSFRVAKNDRLDWLLLLSILIPILSWAWSSLSESQFQSSYPQKLEYLPKLFSFILIAYFLRHSKSFIILFGLSFIAGLVLSPLVSGYGYTKVINHIVNDQRVSLGTINIICVSATFAIALLFSLTVLLPPILKMNRGKGVAFGVFTVLVSILVLIVITTQTRGVILGLLACLMVALIHFIWRFKSKLCILVPLLILVVFSGWHFSSNDQIVSRFERSMVAVDKLMTDGLSAVPQSSSGLRIHMWAAGLTAFVESPIVGQGGHAAKDIMQTATYMQQNYRDYHSHLHNSYVDLLARFGIVGLVWYLALLFYIQRAANSVYQSGAMNRGMYHFTNYFVVFWLVINLFESFVFISRGPVIFTVAVAMIYAFRYQKQPLETGKQESLDNQTAAMIKT